MSSLARERIAYAVLALLAVVIVTGAIRGSFDVGIAMALCGVLGGAIGLGAGVADAVTRRQSRPGGDDDT